MFMVLSLHSHCESHDDSIDCCKHPANY